MGVIAYLSSGLLIYALGFLLVRGLKGMIENEQIIAVSAINNGMLSILVLFTMLMILFVSLLMIPL